MVKYSFEGWNIKQWALANKNNIKLLIAALVGIGTAAVTNVAWGSIASVAGKLIVDSVDYWLSE